MPGQLDYYNRFAENFRNDILNCPEPERWTTDYHEKGRVYQEISQRLKEQQALIRKYFDIAYAVLDIGCGFGRQSMMLAKLGFKVFGIDNSLRFIDLANELFHKHQLEGKFIPGELKDQQGTFTQAVLFDVLEHIRPGKRRKFISEVAGMIPPAGKLLISLPHLKKRLSSRINNSIRRGITQHFPYFLGREEHPYPVPGKKAVLKMIDPYFTLLEFKETRLTDYYAFGRK